MLRGQPEGDSGTLTDSPVDANSVSSLLQTAIEALVAFVAAHGSYHLFWQRQSLSTPQAYAALGDHNAFC